MTPTVTRSGARRTGMSGAFALLKADGKMVRYLAIGPEAEGDHELLAALARSSPDLQRRGRLSWRGRNSNEEGTSSRPSVARAKARLVARGFAERKGVDLF